MALKRKSTHDQAGASLVEYGLVAGFVAVASIGAVVSTGSQTREIFCTASNALAKATSRDGREGCDLAADEVVLPEVGENERYVDAPITMAADFQDVTYANAITGEQVVMTSLSEAPGASFWLDVAISSQDVYEPDREISACYLRTGVTTPICSLAADLSSVEVPVGASAMGFMTSLQSDTRMPWSNDVSISVPASGEMVARSWDVVVSRVNAGPIRDVTFSMADPTLEQTDTGWTYVPFAALEGTYNVPLWLTVGPNGKLIDIYRQACYTMQVGGTPQCGSQTSSGDYALVEVPVGATEIGFAVKAPAEEVGADWVHTLPVALRTEGRETAPVIHEQSVTVTRPNDPVNVAVTFDMPAHTFPAEASGWQYVPFAELEGDFNVPLTLSVLKSGDMVGQYRKACYTMEIGGTIKCGDATYKVSDTATVTVPVGAKEIGFQLTTNSANTQWSTKIPVRLSYSGGLIKSQTVALSRPAP